MRKLLLFSVLAIFLTFGCHENNPIEVNKAEAGLSKAEPNWIKLPDPIEKSLSKTYYNSEWIDVDHGGVISTKRTYWTFSWWSKWNSNKKVTVEASLELPVEVWDRAIYGRYERISLSVDDETASSTFGPHMEFLKPVVYNARFTGLNLAGVDPGSIGFVYQDPSGAIEPVDYDALNVNIEEGIIEIVNARIPHFSRYGFTW